MKLVCHLIVSIFAMVTLVGCAGTPEPFGMHVAKLKAEQAYNPNAPIENVAIVPTGTGERMEGAYQSYTGKQSSGLSGTESQFLEGFSN